MTLDWIAAGTAFWLGLLTAVSPCPLATNLSAVSYLSRELSKPSRVLAAGLLYTLGRTLAYTALGWGLVSGLLAAPALSRFLTEQMNQLLGPLLILTGMVLLELITLPKTGDLTARLGEKAKKLGLIAPLALGAVFAMAFCPTSAALFFGSLLPLAFERQSSLAIPALYGVATGLPVLVFAFIITFAAHRLGKIFQAVTTFELWARRITGTVFILVGILLSLVYIFNIPIPI